LILSEENEVAAETREQKIARLIEKHIRDRNMDSESITTHYNVKHTGIELDPDYFEAHLQVGWGFFRDEPRHLDHMTRNMLISVLLAWRSRPGCYHQGKKGVMMGATYEMMMEAYEAGCIAGGGPTLINGMTALKRMIEEGVKPGSQPGPWTNKWVQLGPVKRKPQEKYAEAAPASTRAEQIIRKIEQYNPDKEGEINKDLAFGAKLDPDFFEGYVRMAWGIFDEKPCFLDPIRREMAIMLVLAVQGRREELYISVKKALDLGATKEQLLEAFEVGSNGGGSQVLAEGLRTLRRIHEEQAESSVLQEKKAK
jgi:alkylhydroperoxidase/carboxymuconolactone decarboxylase family protein YurZ